MPSGYVPGLPKPGGGGESSPEWGTVEYVTSGGSWNVSTASLSDPGESGFWACATSQASNGYTYLMGTSQMNTRAAVQGIEYHNGTNGWTSLMFTLMWRHPNGATWPGTINVNMTGSYLASSCGRFTYTEGFQKIPYGWKGTQHTSTLTSIPTPTPNTNLSPYPGGVAFACISKESGAASGIAGINTASSDAGWIWITGAGQLAAIAYYPLSTTEVETPPICTFTSTTSRNCWNTAVGYVR